MDRTRWAAVAAVVVLTAGGVAAAVVGTRAGTEWIREKVTPPEPRRELTASGRVELRVPAGWTREAESPFDLQVFSRRRLAMAGFFEFHRGDLAEDVTPHDLLDAQVKDLGSKRDDYHAIAPEERREEGDRTLTSALHAGKHEGTEYRYRYTLVEFRDHPELFLVVLQVAAPENYAKALPVFDALLRSAAVLPARAGAILPAAAGAAPPSPQRVTAPSGRVELRFPADWVKDEESEYDVELATRNGRLSVSMNEWLGEDLAADVAPRDLLASMVDGLGEVRKNWVQVGREKRFEDGDRTFTTVLYAGEYGLRRFYFQYVLVEFSSAPDVVAVFLQVGSPSEWTAHEPVLDAITRSVALTPATPAAP
ncbi:MAG TPA: hypothetical protein VEB43_17335 [Anaeromyxobacter sp.]|nr:hypothetical protein [Anaeromyxobacter sp.]